MKKITNYKLTIINSAVLLLSLFSIIYNSSLIIPVLAAESSQSATSSGGLIDKINSLKEEIASKASQLKNEVNKSLQNRIVVGKLMTKQEDKLNIQTKDGDKIALLNDFTLFEAGKSKSLKDIALEDFVVAAGDIDDKGNLSAKKVTKANLPTNKNRQAVFGQVQNISGTTVILKTKEEEIKVSTTAKTLIMADDEIKLNDIDKGNQIVAVGTLDDKTLKARFIYLITPTNP